MKSTNYIVIQGWMCNELGLKGNELLVYALIYGFSQDGESAFMGTRKYIADTFNISMPTVDKALTSLQDKKLIVCKTDHKTFWHYSTGKETLPGEVKKLYPGGKETLPNKIDNTTKKDKSNSKELLPGIPGDNFHFGKSKPKKENLYTKCLHILDNYEFSNRPDIRKLLIQYLNYRMTVTDKPLYANVWKFTLDKLLQMCESEGQDYKSVISQSLERGYLSFYPISSFKGNIMTDLEGMNSPEVMEQEDWKKLENLTEERKRNGLRATF